MFNMLTGQNKAQFSSSGKDLIHTKHISDSLSAFFKPKLYEIQDTTHINHTTINGYDKAVDLISCNAKKKCV